MLLCGHHRRVRIHVSKSRELPRKPPSQASRPVQSGRLRLVACSRPRSHKQKNSRKLTSYHVTMHIYQHCQVDRPTHPPTLVKTSRNLPYIWPHISKLNIVTKPPQLISAQTSNVFYTATANISPIFTILYIHTYIHTNIHPIVSTIYHHGVMGYNIPLDECFQLISSTIIGGREREYKQNAAREKTRAWTETISRRRRDPPKAESR